MLNDLQIPKSQLPSFISCLSLVSKSRHMYVGGGYRGTCTVIRAKGYSSKPEFRTSDLPLLQPECCSRTPPSSPTYLTLLLQITIQTHLLRRRATSREGHFIIIPLSTYVPVLPVRSPQGTTDFLRYMYLGPLIDRISSCSIMARCTLSGWS